MVEIWIFYHFSKRCYSVLLDPLANLRRCLDESVERGFVQLQNPTYSAPQYFEWLEVGPFVSKKEDATTHVIIEHSTQVRPSVLIHLTHVRGQTDLKICQQAACRKQWYDTSGHMIGGQHVVVKDGFSISFGLKMSVQNQ